MEVGVGEVPTWPFHATFDSEWYAFTRVILGGLSPLLGCYVPR